MFIKVTDAATGKPVLLNVNCVSKFEHLDEPGAASCACLATGERARIVEPLREIERLLYITGATDDRLPPVDIDDLCNQLNEAMAKKEAADAEAKHQHNERLKASGWRK